MAATTYTHPLHHLVLVSAYQNFGNARYGIQQFHEKMQAFSADTQRTTHTNIFSVYI